MTLVLHGAVAVTFIAMWLDDSELKRQWFFYTYTAAIIAMPFIIFTGIDGSDNDLDIEAAAERTCRGMNSHQL